MTLVGTDIEQISRIRRAMNKTPGFVHKIFTKNEMAYCNNRGQPAQHYAVRFCAKEALIKSIGIPIDWQEVEIKNETSGQPVVHVRGRTAKALAGRAIRLSLAHAGDYAIATVLIEDKPVG